MENSELQSSDHITRKLWILPRSVCCSQYICPEIKEILENEVTYPKNRNLQTRTI